MRSLYDSDGNEVTDATGHTELETQLARALWQHSYLMSLVYISLGKKTIPVYNELTERMKAIPTSEQGWLNSEAITDGQS
jgi:hypothetical protein